MLKSTKLAWSPFSRVLVLLNQYKYIKPSRKYIAVSDGEAHRAYNCHYSFGVVCATFNRSVVPGISVLSSPPKHFKNSQGPSCREKLCLKIFFFFGEWMFSLKYD